MNEYNTPSLKKMFSLGMCTTGFCSIVSGLCDKKYAEDTSTAIMKSMNDANSLLQEATSLLYSYTGAYEHNLMIVIYASMIHDIGEMHELILEHAK